MKYNYKFQNLLGTVYRKGDVVFSHDGNSVISPVGNRITVYNLKQNKNITLPVESHYNYTAIDVSPNGSVLLAINEKGEAHMISLVTCSVIHKYKFKQQVNAVKFSPDGKYFAACCGDTVFIMTAPTSYSGEFRSFIMKRVYQKAYDDVTCLDWSTCSKLLAVGSKDTTTKIYTVDYLDNINMFSMGGHTDKIVGVFFERKSLDLITVSRNGQVCLWEASIDPDDLIVSEVQISHRKRRKLQKAEDSEDDIDEKNVIEKDKDYQSDDDKTNIKEEIKVKEEKRLFFTKLGRHYIGDAIRSANYKVKLTAAQYHKATKMLITGFSNGVFFLHELPDVNLVHTLSVSEHRISSVAVSPQGDWVAFGCPHIGQLLVWEWQSEQYVMKQQGHSQDMTCVAYSPDGQYIVTGGYDGKVKLWNTSSGFCFVTFSEHSSTVTSIVFSANKKFFVSSSLDGTVRCYDLTRYRNFRTLTSPSLVQFGCAALDASGELCAAGGQDVFEIFLWSVKFGKLLDVLGGHEAPVVSLAFSPTLSSSRLASASWDKTVRLWNCIETSSDCEVIQFTSDALQVAYRPDGEEIAVSTLDGNITFFNATSCEQSGYIEGRNDLGSGRADTDLVTAKQQLKSKAFTTICYSADGNSVLGGGNSKHVCLYSIKEAVLIKKFVITQNRSLDAISDVVNRRLLSEFGNMALVEQRGELEGGDVSLRLPGVQAGDMAERNIKPEVRVQCVRFSPTGESFAVAATEGLLIYSQNAGLDGTFRPFRLETGSTPAAVKNLLEEGSWGRALLGALQLNEHHLIQQCVEAIPPADIELTVRDLEKEYCDRLTSSVARLLEDSRHLEHLLVWARALLSKGRLPQNVLLALEKVLTVKYSQLSKICDFNKYTIRCIKSVAEIAPKQEDVEMMDTDNESSGRGTFSDTD
ncbi:periodic tryptophan protein 2 homolog isoform X1 [Papilio machaon]|uniref:periodic tryptophan protein 2 homolog isoform X1 n=1 Tax=Papilio machaon TaxID=76193 RepID=UPI001E66483B|nr:periodic tryptophan protein 2 homolog isoform X1 [Papilio machaon]